MKQSLDTQRGQVTTRRAFLKQVIGLTGATAGTALLAACGAASTTATPAASIAATGAPASDTIAATVVATAASPEAAIASAVASVSPAVTVVSTTVATPGTAATGAATAQAATPAATTGQSANPAIVAAANAFLATLSDSEKQSVLFDWTNTAQKQRWSNFPEGLFTRTGLMWGNLSAAQQNAWLPVMQATLSTEGYNRVMAEWNADDALAAQDSGGGRLLFGKKYYWIALIGTPSETTAWQWQWGGHHVTVNATIVGSNISLMPSFIGAQPATYTDASGTTVRPLGDIEDEAIALVTSLDATQQKAAILGTSYIDLVLGPGQDGKTLQSEGLPASQMTADQKAAFLKLIGHYTGLVNTTAAATRLAEIQSTLDQTYFSWYGPTTAGSASYFRVTGPTIVIEYSPQEMGGNAANHIHGIYRDPTNDYGAKYTQ